MLRKSKDPQPSPSAAPASTPALPAPSGGARTLIGQHISIQGDIQGSEDLVVEGSVKGSVTLPEHHFTVGARGEVEAEIQAENVTISGRLAGNIVARDKVEITRQANFTGEIKARRFSVEDGAFLKAVIEMEREEEAASEPAIALARPGGESQS